MIVYIATGFESWQLARDLAGRLENKGHAIAIAWWTYHPDNGAADAVNWSEIGMKEARAVARCDAMIAMLPGGRGTHVEIGMAVALGKPVYLLDSWSDRAVPFYHLPGVYYQQTTLECMVNDAAGLLPAMRSVVAE